MKKEKYGFLRETTKDAIKAGIDETTGLHRTGLDEYLSVIFPNTNDWIHNKQIGKLKDGTTCRKRPDYRSESLKLIVEFDGIQHYQKPTQIIKDYENTLFYESLGYTVVRIPYFIQLTNDAVEYLFNKKVKKKLFNGSYPSLGIGSGPADLCPAGIQRMAKELLQFPEQLEVNLLHLWELDDDWLTGASLLDKEILSIINDHQIDFNYLFTEQFNDELQRLYYDAYNYCDFLIDNVINDSIDESSFISFKDFYDMFYIDKFDKSVLEEKLINIFHIIFINKQKQYLQLNE